MGGFPPLEVSNHTDSVSADWEMDNLRAILGVVTHVLGLVHHIRFPLYEILPGSQLRQAESLITSITTQS